MLADMVRQPSFPNAVLRFGLCSVLTTIATELRTSLAWPAISRFRRELSAGHFRRDLPTYTVAVGWDGSTERWVATVVDRLKGRGRYAFADDPAVACDDLAALLASIQEVPVLVARTLELLR